MIPILFHIGPLPVYAFGFSVACGVVLSLWLMSKRAQKTGFPPGEMAFDMVFVSVLSGFLGARLYYIVQNFESYRNNFIKILFIWEGGLIFYGGVIGAFLGLWAFSKVKKVSFAKALDFILPYVALTHAFGRIGCFLNGCCYGKACDLPWAVQFPETPQPVHPTQLYESALDFIFFLFLNYRYGKKRFDGEVAALYFMGYALIRFAVELFRENPSWEFLTYNQWFSIGLIILASLFYCFKSKSLKKS